MLIFNIQVYIHYPLNVYCTGPVMADDTGTRIFEWDENKRRVNVAKHGIDFADAKDVFDDPSSCSYQSHQSYEEERRYVTVGRAKGVLMAVIFTRRGEAIRIISARVARQNERKMYG
jgi:uncharacterized DUF497 family protein